MVDRSVISTTSSVGETTQKECFECLSVWDILERRHCLCTTSYVFRVVTIGCVGNVCSIGRISCAHVLVWSEASSSRKVIVSE